MDTEPEKPRTRNTAPGKRIGQGMWIIFWCLFLGGLAMIFAQLEEQKYNPNQQLQSTTTSTSRQIQLTANRYGHYLLPGHINGKSVNFLIDTGATEVVIPGRMAERLELPRGLAHWVRTANGEIEVFRTHINQLKIGPITLTNIPASINPHMDGEILLGMSALRHLEMRQANNQMTLEQRIK
ncbi:TIGR02281 family clan AA aspartic protease [Motiliproteus sp. MSK22-1]|uniref:retropepsin-like aspartic protease family protein n=1 Tax=Motiliproteus sp. MSK22-1 TaxID=1897630 RepID=UPI0009772869|nr:retropepsin-like aspartic protease [Motiliproteus sp. MSK22-1]OMH32802.1 hypothetical protein BGP75_14870 [Motiliproteus sp. MSK22-1]